MTGGRPRGQERRPHGGHNRPFVVFQRHLGQRGPLHVAVRDQVEGHVDASGIRRHSVGMLIDRLLVERIDFGRLGQPTGRANLLGDLLEPRPGAASEEDSRPLAGEGPDDRTANRPAPSVDHSIGRRSVGWKPHPLRLLLYETLWKLYTVDMATLNVSAARKNLPDAVETARTEAVFLERYGRPAAVLVSPDRYEQLMAALEDVEDVAAFDAAMEEEGPNVPWEQVKADLGWA